MISIAHWYDHPNHFNCIKGLVLSMRIAYLKAGRQAGKQADKHIQFFGVLYYNFHQ